MTRLLADAGIVRNRAKVLATINNARRYEEFADEFGSLGAYVWSYEPDSEDTSQEIDVEDADDDGQDDRSRPR